MANLDNHSKDNRHGGACSGKARVAIALIVFAIIAAAVSLASCNVTRTITTQSQYFQHGDTTCTIVTKTIETYDASKKPVY